MKFSVVGLKREGVMKMAFGAENHLWLKASKEMNAANHHVRVEE